MIMGAARAYEARVRSGRLVLDEPTDLPDGTVVQLSDDPYAHLEEGDEMNDEDRKRLHAALQRGLAQSLSGRGRSMDEFLAEFEEP